MKGRSWAYLDSFKLTSSLWLTQDTAHRGDSQMFVEWKATWNIAFNSSAQIPLLQRAFPNESHSQKALCTHGFLYKLLILPSCNYYYSCVVFNYFLINLFVQVCVCFNSSIDYRFLKPDLLFCSVLNSQNASYRSGQSGYLNTREISLLCLAWPIKYFNHYQWFCCF